MSCLKYGSCESSQKNIYVGAGESLSIAVDMAARESLLRTWGATADHALPFGSRAHAIDFAQYQKPNVSLREICSERHAYFLKLLNIVSGFVEYISTRRI